MVYRFLHVVLFGFSVAASSAYAADADVAAWVQKGGLAPIDPPVPAAAFTLPDLAGAPHALSDYQGRWVLLTFFATWCGPCASEMPSLQSLSTALQGRGFDVLAISTDASKRPIPGFLKRHGATFAVLHDAQGQAARQYQAQAIPISFLIDPAGRVVGVAKGARPWDRFTPIATKLLEEAPWDGTAAPATADPTAPVELPPGVEPPSATLSTSDHSVLLGESVDLAVTVHWQGELKDYVLLPPRVSAPEGLVPKATTAESSSSAGTQQITYHLAFDAVQEGTYALDPVELRYTPAGATEPMIARIAGPTIAVARFTVLGLRPLVWIAGAAGTGGIGLMGVLFLARRRTRGVAQGTEASQFAAHKQALADCRTHRMNGELSAHLDGLTHLYTTLELDPPDDLVDLVEQVRYGGAIPDSRRLDAMERELRRALDARRKALAIADPDFDDGDDE